ncbi:MAG: SGNH/GDSL hydrolase family protein [bacterium]
MFWLIVCAAAVSGGGSPRLRIEYLPAIVYADQPLAVCARVEATRAEPVRLAVALRDAEGTVLAASGAAGTAKPEAPWRCHVALRLARGTPTALDVVLTRASGAGELDKVTVRVLNPGEALPPLGVKGMRLTDAAGGPVVVRIEHRVYRRKQEWPLIRWVAHRIYGDRLGFDRVLLLGETLGEPREHYLAKTAASPAPFEASVLAVPSRSRPPAPPVLRAVAALSQTETLAEPDLAVISLGHRDPDFGTDVLTFHRGLELVAQELERRGCDHLVFLSPLGPGHLARRLEPYAEAARRVARIYHGRYLDLGGELSDEHFAADAPGDRLLLRFPNPAGHQALAAALTRALERLRR